jgi:pyruvate ferredoxin oxidoreductase gamma subunit
MAVSFGTVGRRSWRSSWEEDARSARRSLMFEVRVHGRGGQGVVTAAELLSVAAFAGGHHAQAFPSFGSERTGAPVVSFCRIDGRQIRTREPVSEPDAVIVQDATLVHQVDVFGGLRPGGFVLVNTSKTFEELGLADVVSGLDPGRTFTVAATEIAMRHTGRPVPNAVLLGGFAAMTGIVSLDAVVRAIRDRFGGTVAEKNAAAACEAYRVVRRDPMELNGAAAG